MKFISTRTHGALDYIFGLLLIAFPWLAGAGGTGAESLTPTLLGIFTIAAASMTNYENSLLNIIPMGLHLMLDLLSALFLAAAPWLFGFQDKTYIPFLVFAGIEVLVVIFSKTSRSKDSDNENLI